MGLTCMLEDMGLWGFERSFDDLPLKVKKWEPSDHGRLY